MLDGHVHLLYTFADMSREEIRKTILLSDLPRQQLQSALSKRTSFVSGESVCLWRMCVKGNIIQKRKSFGSLFEVSR